MFSPEKLKPDFSKLSPMAGFKRVFGLDGVMQFFKSLVKVALTALLAWWVLRPHMDELVNLASLEPIAMLPFAADILRRLVFAVAAFLLVMAGADWMWQRQRFMQRMRMSKEELKEDYRQSEGDPHVKARQRNLRIQRAKRRMMQAVPTATVVVMNPTHFAVALKYDASETPAPLCVAKGVDSLALKIREVAEAHGVPIIEDPPLARALYATVDVDEIIPPAHYEAVAKIIGFILHQGRRAVAKPMSRQAGPDLQQAYRCDTRVTDSAGPTLPPDRPRKFGKTRRLRRRPWPGRRRATPRRAGSICSPRWWWCFSWPPSASRPCRRSTPVRRRSAA